MSAYEEFDDLASRSPGSSMDASVLIQKVQDNLQHFNSNVSVLERRMRALNTQEDNTRLREEIIQLSKDTVQLAKIYMNDPALQKLNQQSRSLDQNERIAYNRLTKTFQTSLTKFQSLQKSIAQLEQEMLTRARSTSVRSLQSPDAYTTHPETEKVDTSLMNNDSLETQQQMVFEEGEMKVEQREREMRQLENDIVDINEIFRDLGTMVHDQGELVDNIESNVETAYVRVEKGNRQLESAVRHKSRSRKLIAVIVCILLGILVVIIVVVLILLAVFTDVFKTK